MRWGKSTVFRATSAAVVIVVVAVATIATVSLSYLHYTTDSMITSLLGTKIRADVPETGRDPTQSIDESLANALKSKSRVMCWIPSVEKWIPNRVASVNETWVRRCDGHIFFIGTTQTFPDVVSLPGISDGREHLTEKTHAALTYLYRHHLRDYDWFLRGDDDSFIVMENLRLLLAQYSADRAVHLGHLFKLFVKSGFMSGGAAFALSREALRRLYEDGFQTNKCPPVDQVNDDLFVGRCLDTLGILPGYALDRFGLAAFHPVTPEEHIARSQVVTWLKKYDRFPPDKGKNCCSELTISFHHMQPDAIRVMEHLLYRITVYGRVPDMNKLSGMFQSKLVPRLP